jgi:RND family efflux transporter MFP subunit
MTGILTALAAIGAAGATWWVAHLRPTTSAATPPAAAAKVAQPIKEDHLNVITLAADAVSKLALATGKVERKPMRRTRIYGAEVMIPPGHAIIVSAPLSGRLTAPPSGVPQPGQTVKKGQPVFQLLPLLSPEGRANLASARVEAEGQVNNFQTQLDALRIELDRAKRMLRDQTGSQRQVDEAQARHDQALKSLEAAKARLELLAKVAGEVDKGTSGPLPIDAPDSGLLRSVLAAAEQTVPAGAPLFEVIDPAQVWVRVPVYVGDLPEIDASTAAGIANLTARPGEAGRSASPVQAPPSASATAGTVDLYFELDNRTTHYSPGERVGATLTLRGESESLSVPWSAVIYDIYGGTWVYEQVAERTYRRRRVVVRFVNGSSAALASGPDAGTIVVTAGAAELFGTEVGFSK